jgi:hypothetical protein
MKTMKIISIINNQYRKAKNIESGVSKASAIMASSKVISVWRENEMKIEVMKRNGVK